ncbi:hypothetical protein SNK03_000023 [Fusarium graminearum]|uniref:Chromosome 1, complete genome n=2 Tax=Gibberella zeae TaxID=5518 RepID=I1R977_GIBZE|nr:hypothetical protein FGSG_00004 [Fusarium graminearum PH-1]KAI6762349.1 hypothetical protein HG531_002902 [Fusarium graminearum]ESU05098.1 hypothetical protein FGSG_00004 [Fusarium graminearum PH-1]PCD30286.1 hypothetical protein FGRA07_10436 [Fusarium graminearum]CAF3497139.1 unnamed protein product [Fusarium graminearum]CAF3506930.1 unnamed protein product [Fusarium graminearum]|eukprot:XP_011315583.1 hypothetical protein FGSG_00004 [Fusarium graminearum PH-1]
MVYYAYAKYISADKRYYRYILAAPDAGTIDEWWREASSNANNSLVRLAPDFYTWSGGANVWDLAPKIADKIIISLVSNQDSLDTSNLDTFHQPERADVVSGNSFYIRSKSNPELYWLAKNDQIWATNQGRTRFIFRIDGDHGNNNKNVIIASDEISIVPVGGESKQKYVAVSDDSELVLSGHSCRMYYGDLKRNFLAQGETGSSGSALIAKVEGHGEEWELIQ